LLLQTPLHNQQEDTEQIFRSYYRNWTKTLTSYRDKEPMTPAKIEEHEPTAVKREMTERIAEPGQTGTNSAEAAEIARKKGMAKGTAGAAETGSEYE
jgi:hypothetical protein